MRAALRKIWSDCAGSALVEGTVLMPVLCTLFFGVFEFSYIFYQQHLVSIGVRDAARYLGRVTYPSSAACQTNARNLAATGSISGTSPPRVSGWSAGDITVNVLAYANPVVDGVRLRGGDNVKEINVTTSYTYTPLGFWGYFGFAAPTLSVTHIERWERDGNGSC